MSGRRDKLDQYLNQKKKEVKIIICVLQLTMSKLDMRSSFCHQCLNVNVHRRAKVLEDAEALLSFIWGLLRQTDDKLSHKTSDLL